MLTTKEDFTAAHKDDEEEGFKSFMATPATRLMMSMVPPTEEKREVLETLLREAFNAGHGRGSVFTGFSMLMSAGALKPRPPR